MCCALVLSAGGVTGIAWQLGVLGALAESGVDLTRFDPVVGTSAGATVGAQLATGQLAAAIAMQTGDSAEITVDFDLAAYRARIDDLVRGAASAAQARARIGAMALAAATVSQADRHAAIRARLPTTTWPVSPELRITAVDAHTGALVVFDRTSGVPLPVAVAASAAVPGVWPPVSAGGTVCVDGGIRSQTNADIAGAAMVVVLVSGRLTDADRRRLDRETAGCARWALVAADDEALASIGPNVLDPECRPAALSAGARQGARCVADVADVLLRAG